MGESVSPLTSMPLADGLRTRKPKEPSSTTSPAVFEWSLISDTQEIAGLEAVSAHGTAERGRWTPRFSQLFGITRMRISELVDQDEAEPL